jgi:hypothetical protein
MPLFGVTLITDVYYEVEAEDFDEAIDAAYELLDHEDLHALTWDCNEAVDLDE